jgi:major membrane immunogen (membrane-anchored lipoprotein)
MWMQKRNILTCTLAIACLLLVGCARSGIGAYSFEDAQAQKLRAHKKQFNSDEVPTLCVYGYGGKKVTVKVFDSNAARVVREQTAVIPEEAIQTFWWGPLNPGSYQAVLYLNGARKETTTFTVAP